MNRGFAVTLFACTIGSFAIAAAKEPAPTNVAPAQTTKANCANPIGAWKNQMGSKLTIKTLDATTGALSGEYQTATGAGGSFPLVGWVNELPPDPSRDNARIITFTVHWTGVGSITAWTGVCRGTDQLNTVWQLGRANSGFEWDHVLSGADQFAPL